MKKIKFALVALLAFASQTGCKKNSDEFEKIEQQKIAVKKFEKVLTENVKSINEYFKIHNLKPNQINLNKEKQNLSNSISLNTEPDINYFTEIEAQNLLEPLRDASVELLSAFDVYEGLVEAFGESSTDIITSAFVVFEDIHINSETVATFGTLTSGEVFNCIGIALGIGSIANGLINWGGRQAISTIIGVVARVGARFLGAVGLAYAIWGLTDCLVEESAD